MDKQVGSVGQECGPSCSKFGDTWTYNSMTGRRASVITQPFISKTFSSYKFSFMFIFATTYLISFTSAYGNFSVSSTTYSCSSNGNLICLGQAHVYNGTANNGIKDGRLSLVSETLSVATDGSGLAYYNQPIRFKDPSTNGSASFNTSFSIDIVIDTTTAGDGMAFVISADNQTVGSQDRNLGIFTSNGVTSFKSIVVEFDGYYNEGPPEFDINDNHVSFDFSIITTNATANASNVGMVLLSNKTLYAWVEYSSETQKLEARVSYNNYRPVNPLLESTLDIYDKVEEYMWIGFSAGTSGWVSNYYIGDWTFESYGIPPTSSLSSLTSPSPSPSSATSTKATTSRRLIVGISVGVPAFLLASIFIFLFVWRRSRDRHGYRHCPLRRAEYTKEDTMAQFEGTQAESFSYRQLSLATNGFNEESKLGQGGFGSVHRGVLPLSAIPVAVKKINSDSSQGEKEFMAEVSIISRLRHRNLIGLLGWCKDVGRKKLLLVYELMPNKSLDKWLFAQPEDGTTQLSWEQRFNIVTGTAAALDYLHQGWTQQVIHRDIKSSNIMLDENWNAKLGDFGLARLVDHERTGATTIVAGTYGYIAPEVVATSKYSDKTDVFAFGIVVLEVACGRKALSASVPPDEMVLVDWVWRKLNEGDLLSTVDNRLRDYDPHWMELVLTVGLLCAHRNPLARPSMRQVVQVLAGDTPVPSIQGSIRDLQFSSISQAHSINGLDSRGNTGSISGSTSRSSFNLSAATGASTTVKSSNISLNSISSVPEEISSGDRHW